MGMTGSLPKYRKLLFVFMGAVFVTLLLSAVSYVKADEPVVSAGEPVQEQTLQAALRMAYINNPSLRAARTELRVIHESLPQALSGWKPTLSADASIAASDIDGSNFGGGNGSTAKDLGFSLDQPLYRGGQTFSETTAARYTIAAQNALLKIKGQDVLQETATAYMDVLRDQALLELSRNNREVIAQELEASRERFDVGELTRTDVSQSEARLAKAEADVTTVRGNLRSSRAVFEEVIGMPAGRLVQPVPHFELLERETLEGLIRIAEQESPDVAAAVYAHKAAKEDINGVFGELLPEIGLFSSWNKTLDPAPGVIDEQTTKMIGLSASIPLYQAGSVRSRVRQAKEEANQRYLEILESKRLVRRETIENWEALQAAKAEIRSREAQVEASRVAQEGVRQEAEVGSRTILDILDADQEFLDAQVALVTAKRNKVVATFALLATLGLLSPERLGFSEDSISLKGHLKDITWSFFDMDVDRVADLD